MERYTMIIYITVFVLFCVKAAEGGECCRAYYDLIGEYHSPIWCDNYCCVSLGKYDCCDNSLLRAPDSDRVIVCAAWFKEHIWAPITISIIGLLLVIGCCVCCCRLCCCRSNGRTVIVQGGQPAAPVVVQSTTQMSQNSIYNAGYNQ